MRSAKEIRSLRPARAVGNSWPTAHGTEGFAPTEVVADNDKGPDGPLSWTSESINLCGLTVVPHPASSALLSGSLILTTGLVLAVLALLLLGVWLPLPLPLPRLIGLGRLIAAGLLFSSHRITSLISAHWGGVGWTLRRADQSVCHPRACAGVVRVWRNAQAYVARSAHPPSEWLGGQVP